MRKTTQQLQEDFYPTWQSITGEDKESYSLSQIHAMLVNKWEESQRISNALGISFAVDGYSHWKLIEQDQEVYSKWVPQTPSLTNSRKGYHVATMHEHLTEWFNAKKESLT